MPYYRRRRRGPGDPVRDLVIDAFSLVAVAIFICGFIWLFSQPGMWNFNILAARTPTPVASEVPAGSPGWGAVAVLGIIASIISGLGLFVLGVIWLMTRGPTRHGAVRGSSSATQAFPFQSNTSGPPASTESTNVQSANQLLTWNSLASQPTAAPTLPEEKLDVEAHRLMKPFEVSFFWALRHALGEDNYIFPQIPLRELLPTSERQQVTRELSGMLYKGVVDFVLADPTTLQAKLACEFDDPSHHLADARARDRRKDEFLSKVGLPLVRFSSKGNWELEALRKIVRDAIVADCAIPLLSEGECQFFRLAREAKPELFIFPKIALKGIVHRRKLLPSETYKTWENETLDFVLAHPKYLGPLVAIDLRGSFDPEKNRLLRQAGIPILSFDQSTMPTAEQLRLEIGTAIEPSTTKP